MKISNRTLIIAVLINLIFSGGSFAETGFLGFPLEGYHPYSIPISSVFDHSLDSVPSEINRFEVPYNEDGVVIAFTGEKGKGISGRACFQQDNRYIFRLSGNYQGTASLGKTYLCADGHPGTNFRVPLHTDVLAAADGTIIESQCDRMHPRYGKYIKIDHGNGYYSIYGNLDACIETSGTVSKGQHIAESGNSPGNVDYQLHFQVRYGNERGTRYSVDPYGWQGSNNLWDVSRTACPDTFEPNNSFARAYEFLKSGDDYKSTICSSDDQDIYVLQVTRPGNISFSLQSPPDRDYQLELYDKSSVKVDRAHAATGEMKKISFNGIKAGTYYVRIYGEKGDHDPTAQYTFSGTWPGAESGPVAAHIDIPPSADFIGFPTKGISPITVHYSNSSEGHNLPLRFRWDFNNDGIIDSELESPSYTYNAPGRYTVKLTVLDSRGKMETLTRTEYVKVDHSTVSQENSLPEEIALPVLLSDRRWDKVGTNKYGAPLYIDSKTISYEDNDVVRLWAKTVDHDNELLVLLEIDCDTTQYRTLQINNEWNPSDMPPAAKWRFIFPETATEIIYDAMCSKNKSYHAENIP